ncbi:MAG: hypothetical protein V7608_4825 [Hyphomicrobiales bacterium]|jgi:hypothetical protein
MVKRIIEALDDVLANEMFRHSPQLATFLRFIVETSLDGDRGRIEGDTIGEPGSWRR